MGYKKLTLTEALESVKEYRKEHSKQILDAAKRDAQETTCLECEELEQELKHLKLQYCGDERKADCWCVACTLARLVKQLQEENKRLKDDLEGL